MQHTTILRPLPTRHLFNMKLKHIVNKIMKPFGRVLVKRSRFEQILAAEYSRVHDSIFVQIGANDGVKFDNLFDFVTKNKCSGFVIEPIKSYFELLRKNYDKYPNITPIRTAIHKTLNYAIIYKVSDKFLSKVPDWAQGIASFNDQHHKKLGIPSEFMTEEQVDCIHLMDLFSTKNIKKIDLLQIDAEGYDTEIIKMINFDIIKPTIIKYEHLSSNDNVFIRHLLLKKGYNIINEGNDTIAVLSGRFITSRRKTFMIKIN